ncbi:lamin tail domain-containing protein [Nonomuraea sp. NPDC046802]|uniref:lamin tail domain-containing protein n=1 Tax=Nonomuraea sp. NPDC046802 TaxID=3154919 RepID=UPI0033CFAA72
MRISKSAILLSAVLAASGVVGGSTAASADVADLSITRIGYNANGVDTWFNRNKEYVDVTNTGAAAVDVKGLVVEDAWAHANGDDNPRKCNTWTVNSLPGVDEVDGKLMLQAGHTVRVYNGSGSPAVSGEGGRFHLVYANSKCGYRGHVYNNGGDTIWISKGGASESVTYNFDNGYYIKP